MPSVAPDGPAVSPRRLPFRSVVAAYTDDPIGLVGLTVGGGIIAGGEQPTVTGWAVGVLVAVVLGRFVPPLYTFAALRFAVSAEGLWISRGLLTRRVRGIGWSAVTAVEVDAPWNHRALGLARVTITQTGGTATDIRLPGIHARTAAGLAALAGVSEGPADPQRAPDGAVSSDDGDGASAQPFARSTTTASAKLVHRATVGDLLVAALIYGRIATLGAAGLLAVLDLLGSLELLFVPNITGTRELLVISGQITVAILAVGAAATVVRYWGLRTVVDGQRIMISHGLLTTRERSVAADSVVGVELRRNLLELALGRVRLSLMTTDSASRLGSNLVLPSLREPVAAALIAASLPQRFTRSSWDVSGPWRPTLRAGAELVGVAGSAAVMAVVLVTRLRAHIAYGVVAFLAVAWLLHTVGRSWSSRFSLDLPMNTLEVSTTHLAHQRRLLDLSAVHHLTALTVGTRVLAVQVNYFAGIPRRVTALRPEAEEARRLAGAVARQSREGMAGDCNLTP